MATLTSACALSLGIVLIGTSAPAQQLPPGFGKGEQKGFENGRPPGWTNDKSQRKGWQDGTSPPGIAKDQGVRKGFDQGAGAGAAAGTKGKGK